jgi:hypothetical protein
MIRKRLSQILMFVGVSLVPILVLLLTYRRECSVMLAFASYILDVYRYSLTFFIFMAMASLVFFWQYPAVRLFVRNGGYIAARFWIVAALLVACSILSLWRLGKVEYRIFSEVWYQERALKKLDGDDILGARLICERYVQLFPQRRSDGGMPDPVCVPLYKFTTSMATLKKYIERQHVDSTTIDGLPVGVGWATRRKALVTLEHLAGGATGDREGPTSSGK